MAYNLPSDPETKWILEQEMKRKQSAIKIAIDPPDKRQWMRYNGVGKLFDFESDNKKHLRSMEIKDISAGGMQITTEKKYNKGDKFECHMKKIFSEGVALTLSVNATVLNCKYIQSSNRYNINLKFADNPKHEFNKLLSFLQSEGF